jgi:hypothetical protein
MAKVRTKLFRKLGNGYIGVANGRHTKPLHHVVAQLALGKPLPRGTIVHHIDGDKRNNFTCNLLICPTQAYHLLIHQRTRALAESGHADWRKCKYCSQWDAPSNLLIYSAGKRGQNVFHRACHLPKLRAAYRKRKARSLAQQETAS